MNTLISLCLIDHTNFPILFNQPDITRILTLWLLVSLCKLTDLLGAAFFTTFLAAFLGAAFFATFLGAAFSLQLF